MLLTTLHSAHGAPTIDVRPQFTGVNHSKSRRDEGGYCPWVQILGSGWDRTVGGDFEKQFGTDIALNHLGSVGMNLSSMIRP